MCHTLIVKFNCPLVVPDLVVVDDVHVHALDQSDHHGTLLNGFLVKKYMFYTLVVKFNCPLPDLVVVDDVHVHALDQTCAMC